MSLIGHQRQASATDDRPRAGCGPAPDPARNELATSSQRARIRVAGTRQPGTNHIITTDRTGVTCKIDCD
ncbi:hypothetical protein BA895_08555 [Humibacillus sp. DSM 29435]|nr:hypothetical protein BA895_08555 [Humibacillus sp. DSM 29435]